MQGRGTSKPYEVRTMVTACCTLYAYLQAYYWNRGSVNWSKTGEQPEQPDGKSAAAVKPTKFYAYQYGSASWGDQLTGITQYSITSINNSPALMILSTQGFSYDSMGNPTGYHDKTLTWEGKQLTGSAASTSGQTLSYAYDQNGLRTQKTVIPTTNATATIDGMADTTATNDTADITATNGIAVTTNYYYNGSVLMGMVTGSGTTAIHQLFSYDVSGNVVSVDYSSNGGTSFTTYYYLRNAQNDVVKLIDGSGNTVVQYTYDSWGKLIATIGTLASTVGQKQPFRYRGYVYDAETGWYYLQSRYYDPTTCRFISADVLLSTGQGVLGHNAYAYCGNNPINNSDPTGQWWIKDAIKWLAKNVCDPVIETIQEGLSRIDYGTYTVGIGGSAAFGVAGTATVGVSFDTEGSMGLIVTTGGGGGSPSASLYMFTTITNAPQIYTQRGMSCQIGGSVDIYGASVGAEYVTFKDADTGQMQHGGTLMAGIGAPVAAEVHGEVCYSWVYGFNLFKLWDSIYDSIVEW